MEVLKFSVGWIAAMCGVAAYWLCESCGNFLKFKCTGRATKLPQPRIHLQSATLELLQHLIEGCFENNRRDQKTLYERYYGYCLKTVFRYIYRYDHATDVVNDGFVKLFRNFGKFNYTPGDELEMVLMGWMRRIMINTAIDHLRRNNFMPEIGDISDSIWMQPDKSQAADQRVLYKELIQQIKRLPPSYRTVFNLYVIDGFTHHEISEKLGISVGTSKSNLSKARAQLQKFIKNSDNEIEYAASN